MGWYRNQLVRWNKSSGSAVWWFVAAAGMAIMLVWVATALPWLVLFTGGWAPALAQYTGDYVATGVKVYNTWTFEGKAADYYFLVVFFGVAIAKFGLLVWTLGINYAAGMRYAAPFPGHPFGHWYKAM